jgi:hypothetical protein
MLKLLLIKQLVSIVTALAMFVFKRPVAMFPESQVGNEDKTNILTVCKSSARKLIKHRPQGKQRAIFKHFICSEITWLYPTIRETALK